MVCSFRQVQSHMNSGRNNFGVRFGIRIVDGDYKRHGRTNEAYYRTTCSVIITSESQIVSRNKTGQDLLAEELMNKVKALLEEKLSTVEDRIVGVQVEVYQVKKNPDCRRCNTWNKE